MVLYPNKLPESERVCFGICILTICFVTGLYILLQIIMLLYFFLGDFSAEELW